ncbi:major facilitator superfamily domain-containing protein [Microdochium bolleyi]|uniref:Major facilitator superfamily domain-containing protein n=1 Tax=Microdochium bolleyi TaxID=196109 RepID=A0A136JD02_9PEZI|nr:major facilitator superfamily domain-containing protein [Microdochium bolleyi]
MDRQRTHRRATSQTMSEVANTRSLYGRKASKSISTGTVLPPTQDFSDVESHDSESIHEKPPPKPQTGPVSWMSLPRKDQLLILFLARVVDFLQVASLQAFVFYQLKSLDPRLTDAEISSQAGWLQGAFTGAQVLTAMWWGKAADAPWCGRKMVLIIGTFGTAISCFGYAFSSTFAWCMFWRMLGGSINGTVGIIRTMVAEVTVERKYQSRAFLILPISFNVAAFIGPVMGGLLADPAANMPGIFGKDAILGFDWVRRYPYAIPSLLNCLFLSLAGWAIILCLEETLPTKRGQFDYGLHLASRIKQKIFGKSSYDYARLDDNDQHTTGGPYEEKLSTSQPVKRSFAKLPFNRIWTKNVLFTLITGAFYDFHLGAFQNMWSLFLSTPRALPEQVASRSLPFVFTGGLGFPAASVGFATSIIGFFGMFLQLFVYPKVHARLGTLRGFQLFLALFPIAYFLAPYLAVMPSSSEAPAPVSGPTVWIFICLVLAFHVFGRTITLPASIILVNNCSPHPSVLGTIHGLGQSVSAGFRTVGPIVGGAWYGSSLEMGMVGASWWGVACMSLLGCAAATLIYEGSGHEIYLEGEEEEIMSTPLQTVRTRR